MHPPYAGRGIMTVNLHYNVNTDIIVTIIIIIIIIIFHNRFLVM